jgi:NAD(P)H dehydrogenase (quinone)
VIEAAKAAGVELIAYTSVLRAETSTLPIAGEHPETEELLLGVGIAAVILRMAGTLKTIPNGSRLP